MFSKTDGTPKHECLKYIRTKVRKNAIVTWMQDTKRNRRRSVPTVEIFKRLIAGGLQNALEEIAIHIELG